MSNNQTTGISMDNMPSSMQFTQEKGLGNVITVDREGLYQAASALQGQEFDLFMFAAGVDYPDSIRLVYRVYSTKKNLAVFLKTEVPKSDPVVSSLVPLWPAAGWHERETYDLYGVEFKGHPDLRRILMPEDWVGYPLRKDYSDDHMIVMDGGPKKEKAAPVKDKEKE